MLEIRRDVMSDWVARKPVGRDVAPIVEAAVAVIAAAVEAFPGSPPTP